MKYCVRILHWGRNIEYWFWDIFCGLQIEEEDQFFIYIILSWQTKDLSLEGREKVIDFSSISKNAWGKINKQITWCHRCTCFVTSKMLFSSKWEYECEKWKYYYHWSVLPSTSIWQRWMFRYLICLFDLHTWHFDWLFL